MNNLYVISRQDSNKQIGAVVPIDEGYNLGGMENSFPLDSDGLSGEKRIKHRYHRRFQLRGDPFALTRPMSAGPLKIRGKGMGGIACAVYNAKPARLGRINNISMGGLMFHHVDIKCPLGQNLVLDILSADCGFYLANLPFKIIADVVLSENSPGDPIAMRQVRLEFKNLSSSQHGKLEGFIFSHGVETM